MSEPKYPDVYVQLVGNDGGVGAILARTTRELHEYRDTLSDEDAKQEVLDTVKALRAGVFGCADYGAFLRMIMETVSVGSPEDYE